MKNHLDRSDETPKGSDASTERLVREEQVRMVFEHSRVAIIATLLSSGALAMFMRNYVGDLPATTWMAMTAAIVAMRAVHFQYYSKYSDINSSFGRRSFVLLLFLQGLVWGLAALFLTPLHDLTGQAFLLASLIGMCALAAFGLNAQFIASAAFNIPVLLVSSVVFFLRTSSFHWFALVIALISLATILGVARRSERTITEMLRLRYNSDLLTAKLGDALKAAELHSKVKSQFLATMSHELRTPLHGILGLTRIARDESNQETVRDHLALASRSGQHLLGLINDILDFSRIEAGHLEIKTQNFNLTELLEDVASLTAVTAQGKGLTLVKVLDIPSPCWVRGDPARIRQVLINLLGNAVKFTDSGEVRLTVSIAESSAGKPTYVFIVRDSGIGIAADQIPHIFDAFHQVDSSFGRRFAGTGLGLAISREISLAMGGGLSCTSELGVGSAFTLTMPLERGEEDAFAQSSREPVSDGKALRGSVLIVEDNEVNALVVEADLRRLGLGVEHLMDGKAAVHRVCDEGARPDLILMDCQMPVMDGFEATRLIRRFEDEHQLPPVPIVALTANALNGDSERCIRAGMDAHLAKPFNAEDLEAMLRRFLCNSSERRGSTNDHPFRRIGSAAPKPVLH